MTTIDDTPADSALSSLRRARDRFLSGRPPGDGVPEDLAEAWRRARFFGVPRDLVALPRVRPPEDSPLLAAARPALDRVAPTLSGEMGLVLVDSRCRALWSGGGRYTDPSADVAGLDLSEKAVGHNSAALALRTGRRAEVHGPEHFLDLWQEVSAVSVPLYEPTAGRPAGTITVVAPLGEGRTAHPGAAVAEATAHAVETELLGRARPPERVLLDAYLRQRADGAAVVSLDGSSRLVSPEAARLLSHETLARLERHATALLRDADAGPEGADAGPEDADAGPEGAHSGAPEEIAVPDGAGLTVRMTRVVHGGEVVGAVATVCPARRARAAERPGPDRLPGLVGTSPPWRVAVSRATELARATEPLLLIGEPGVGKTALARALLGRRDTAAPRLVDAAEQVAGEVPRWCRALAEGDGGAPPLLLRHAERLGQSDVAALLSLLEERPAVPLVATHTPGAPTGPCLSRLLDILSARSVTLPPLRERVEDIPALLAGLARRPSPGRPPLAWSLDARRALEQHTWPGNVTELAHVVREVAERRRATGPVRREELPYGLRVPPATRRLSGMERAERTAILEALRRHGDNKVRAAESLGIGRATLYRKLRAYGMDQA
ncbi:sigma-54-dependent Fis family transcriptional regulator [Streptomyces violaceusniger]|uniref:Sigma54 specific transcriptional regulator, Fis family n=1 Tax=Streptomyces violaceusniger (strain Tu 4113) TaxID=653045 RepID=G2NTL6_STRV4|nr:helix-turn-helix domain-containing protein [Streptomyces violaceusniger]AEM83374.1 sigma54 specific transcriptional regulator, Fis family [Streptomyces violaceusniger Tu 4113]